MTEDSDFVNVPRRVLLMTDPVYFWERIPKTAKLMRLKSYNKAFWALNDEYYQVFGRFRFADINSARNAYKYAIKKHKASGENTYKMLQVYQNRHPNFTANILRVISMDEEKLQPGIQWAEDIPGGIMTKEKAEALGLGEAWAAYEAERALPPVVLTRKEFERLCRQVPGVPETKINR